MKYIYTLFFFLLGGFLLYSQANITEKNILEVFYTSPLENLEITSDFGNRFHPIKGKITMHYGVDLKAYYKPIYAVCTGRIIESGYNSLSGNYIVLEDFLLEGVYYYYLHLSERNVLKNQNVQKGKKIGVTGNTGMSTGPHLHFGIKKGGKFINPTLFLDTL